MLRHHVEDQGPEECYSCCMTYSKAHLTDMTTFWAPSRHKLVPLDASKVWYEIKSVAQY